MPQKKQSCAHGITPKGDCGECRRAYMRDFRGKYASRKQVKERDRRSAQRVRAIEHLGGRCVDCGNDDHRVLVFDHLADKVCNVARLLGGAWSCVLEELQKCELVCANCHQIHTFVRIPAPVDVFQRTYTPRAAKRFSASDEHAIDGVTKTIGEWAAHFGVSVRHVAQRITQNGWSVDRALSTPLRRVASVGGNA